MLKKYNSLHLEKSKLLYENNRSQINEWMVKDNVKVSYMVFANISSACIYIDIVKMNVKKVTEAKHIYI